MCEKLWYRFFDFWIGYTGGDIFRYDPVKRQKMVKLSLDETRRKIGQLTVCKKLAAIPMEHDATSLSCHSFSAKADRIMLHH
ncbi:MAG: hypothetical protein JRE10_11980 [Deltaproteobacteria bacterium]|nr:hypothetical protein [Deltaproteobacteria bacterium]